MINRVVTGFLAFCLLTAGTAANAGRVRVAVASNFADTLRVVAEMFAQQGEHVVQVVSGSTGKHYAQISNGAPFDVFLAADTKRPLLLEKAGIGVPGSRFTYALGRLVLWSPSSDKVDAEGGVLSRGDFKRLAIANPRLAPYGRAAREVLVARKLWLLLQPKLVQGENIAQTYQFIASGNAGLGFVAWSQLLRKGHTPRGSWWHVPRALYQPIEQQALQLRDTSAARAFLAFLRSPQTRAVIKAHGYDLP